MAVKGSFKYSLASLLGDVPCKGTDDFIFTLSQIIEDFARIACKAPRMACWPGFERPHSWIGPV
jgi:hypothetical protein